MRFKIMIIYPHSLDIEKATASMRSSLVVEDRLHWLLDATFREDESRIQGG